MTILQILLIALAAAALVGAGYLTLRALRHLRAVRAPELPIIMRGPAGAAEDYAWTGQYFPINYWSTYWPQYGTAAPPAPTAQRILGSSIRRAGRGL